MANSSNLALEELIENDLRDEPLRDNDRCGDLRWQENNSGCGARNCRSMGKAILWWPDVLVVHLKRFEPNATRTGFSKIDRPVCYGKNLQVLDSPEYTLRAVVMHLPACSQLASRWSDPRCRNHLDLYGPASSSSQ